MRYFITGGAGFVGVNLVEKLLLEGNEVVVYDNLSSGKKEPLDAFVRNPRFHFVAGDVLDAARLAESMRGADVLFHLAANSDIRFAENSPEVELNQGIIATYNVLQAMKKSGATKIVFTSSSTVYGDAGGQPLSEDFGPLVPISFYGSSKLAAEGLICAFCHMYKTQGWIFRLANIVGKGLTHGVIFDFVRKLRNNPRQLEILGDGKQTKPYLHVSDCVDGMLFGLRNSDDTIGIFNLSPQDAVSVDRIAQIVAEEMGLKNVTFGYTGGRGGWKGDVPRVRMKADRLKALGWKPSVTSEEAVRRAAREVLSQTGNS
ncbi:MAG: NAD-dependent epimerase/dehydratase family protein [bacterium]|nr:NAD-dependent epimerase/dehydratase family protein [bacterium]